MAQGKLDRLANVNERYNEYSRSANHMQGFLGPEEPAVEVFPPPAPLLVMVGSHNYGRVPFRPDFWEPTY